MSDESKWPKYDRVAKTKNSLDLEEREAQRCFAVVVVFASGFFQRNRKIRTFNVTFAEPYKESEMSTTILGMGKVN